MAYKRPGRRKFHFVYEIRCKETGKFYRGKHSTDDLDDGYLGSGRWISNGVRKHGKERYERIILEMCSTSEEAFAREKELIAEVRGQTLCMNQKEGGKGLTSEDDSKMWERPGFREKTVESMRQSRQRSWSDPEWKAKTSSSLSSAVTKLWEDEEYRAKVSSGNSVAAKKVWENPLYREQFSKAAKERMSDPTKCSQFGTCWIVHPDHGPRKIKKDQIDSYLSDGWVRGRTIK